MNGLLCFILPSPLKGRQLLWYEEALIKFKFQHFSLVTFVEYKSWYCVVAGAGTISADQGEQMLNKYAQSSCKRIRLVSYDTYMHMLSVTMPKYKQLFMI